MNLPPGLYNRFSNLAYEDPTRISHASIPDGWKIISFKNDAETGYHGQAFEGPSGEVVIAHRGSSMEISLDTLKDWSNNGKILMGDIPPQFEVAEEFSKSLHNQYPDAEFSHTGHSLGGVLSQLCAYVEKSSAVTFETAGTAELIRKLRYERGISHGIGLGDENMNPDQFQNYVVRGNFFRGKTFASQDHYLDHVGEMIYMDPVLPNESPQLFNLKHLRSSFNDCFDENDNFVGTLENEDYLRSMWEARKGNLIPDVYKLEPGWRAFEDKDMDFESFKEQVLGDLMNTKKEFLGLSGFTPSQHPVPQPVPRPTPISAEDHESSSSASGEDEEFMQAVDQLLDLQQAIVSQVNAFTNRNQILIQSLQAI